MLLTAIVLFRLCPLAAYGRSHDKSSLLVWWVGNQTSTKKLLHKLFRRATENSLLLYLLCRISNFPICLLQMGFWKYGNASVDFIFSISMSACDWWFQILKDALILRTNMYVFHFFLAPSAWECLISPSSSRPLLYDANKISPSFMLALTRSHLSRAFVGVALSYTCSNLPAILCYLYCAEGLPFVLWKCVKVTT